MTYYLEAQAVSCVVGGATLLHALTARFATGAFTAILGPNGAGKSTLLSLLCGQRKASQGQVFLQNQRLDSYPAQALARRRALLPQDLSVAFDYTVQDVVELGRYPPGVAALGFVQKMPVAARVGQGHQPQAGHQVQRQRRRPQRAAHHARHATGQQVVQGHMRIAAPGPNPAQAGQAQQSAAHQVQRLVLVGEQRG
ncbi:ATP-binding cassette domain-containing protein [Rhodoferax sp.]|uniref:ATP-binding cassette domain-containing protein n=1 Tax=Rhodoferax sp. TaxID=50421 RepID=UPI0025E51FB4|nr:ATP-binding cassette domain-containing protein [Rhodoferax sp.]